MLIQRDRKYIETHIEEFRLDPAGLVPPEFQPIRRMSNFFHVFSNVLDLCIDIVNK